MRRFPWLSIGLAVTIQQAVAENRTILSVDLTLSPQTHDTSETLEMQSSGFVDLAFLTFNSVDESSPVDTLVDIVVFAQAEDSTDPADSGIGTKDGIVCCTKDFLDEGECTEEGSMIINDDLFEGVLLSVTMLAGSTENVTIDEYDFDPLLFVDKRGTYSLLFANCDAQAAGVEVTGFTVWESLVTAEDVQQTVPFYIVLTCAYLAILSWFCYLMNQNQSSRVQLEYYLLGTIALGFIATMFETIDYSIYELHLKALSIITIFFDTCKNGFARIVLMMLSAGWGVTVAQLERLLLITFLSLGIVYMVLSFTFEVAKLFEVADVQEGNVDDDVSDLGTPFQYDAYIRPWVDIFIWYLIFTRLSSTMQHLEQNNQERKLERYNWLLRIMILAVLMNMAAVFIVIGEIASNGNVDVAVLPEVSDAGFFLVMCCVAYLWRPNPNAREYAYAEELSGVDDGVYDLELTENSPTVLPGGEDGGCDGDTVATDREFT